jgi:hypothetical protein
VFRDSCKYSAITLPWRDLCRLHSCASRHNILRPVENAIIGQGSLGSHFGTIDLLFGNAALPSNCALGARSNRFDGGSTRRIATRDGYRPRLEGLEVILRRTVQVDIPQRCRCAHLRKGDSTVAESTTLFPATSREM